MFLKKFFDIFDREQSSKGPKRSFVDVVLAETNKRCSQWNKKFSWTCIAAYGRVWPCMAMYGRV